MVITQVTRTKFLGVITNDTLSWTDHIRIILNKLSKSIGVIRRVSCYLPVNTLKSLYYTMVHSHYEYCKHYLGVRLHLSP